MSDLSFQSKALAANAGLFEEELAKREREAVMASFGAHIRHVKQKQLLAIEAAKPALERLVTVCAQKTGQSYKVRELLYSLWNGQAASLLEIVTVDWAIKEDLLAVLLAFGSEPKGEAPFYYDAISDAFERQGLMDWFTEAHRTEVLT